MENNRYKDLNIYFKNDLKEKKDFYKNKSETEILKELNKREMWKIYNKVLDELIEKNNHSSVIDVGCGMGNFLFEIIRRNYFKTIVGMDILEETFQIAKNTSYFNKVRFEKGNLLNMKYQNQSFDITFCLNLLHHIHIKDLEIALNELSRVTKSYLIIEIRNKKNILNLSYTKFKLNKYKNLPTNTNSIMEINEILEKSRFKLEKVECKNHIPNICRRLVLIYKSREDGI